MASRRTFGVIPISYFYQSGRATALGRAFSRFWAAWASLGLPPRRQVGLEEYLRLAPGARPHIGLGTTATIADCRRVAPNHPVFRILYQNMPARSH